MLYEKNIGQCYELNTRVQAQIVDVYDNGVSGVSVEVETEYGDTGTINLFDTELRFRKRIDNSEFRIMDGIICKSNREEYDICIQRVDKRKVMISVRESEDQSIISDAIIVLNKKQTLKMIQALTKAYGTMEELNSKKRNNAFSSETDCNTVISIRWKEYGIDVTQKNKNKLHVSVEGYNYKTASVDINKRETLKMIRILTRIYGFMTMA